MALGGPERHIYTAFADLNIKVRFQWFLQTSPFPKAPVRHYRRIWGIIVLRGCVVMVASAAAQSLFDVVR